MSSREARSICEGDTYRVVVEAGHHDWVLDEPNELGGADAGATPVDALLGALLGCLTISFQYAARKRGVPIDRIKGWVAANEDRYIRDIAVELEVWSTAPEADVRSLLPAAERGCFVRNVLTPDITYSLALAVWNSAEL